ncbi:hypothetical protein [Actinokineospora sp.]|uniref:hypothetical protein n=1 Tax=Actinokineospora sp. TaxID=1872133 RepID=UPI00403797F2
MAEPIFETEPPGDEDPWRIRVLRGAPAGESDVRIVFRNPGGLRGMLPVRRSRAEVAVKTWMADAVKHERELTLAEAAHYLDQTAKQATANDTESVRRAHAIDLDCPNCLRKRRYHGEIGILLGEKGLMGGVVESSMRPWVQHAYVCQGCGSTLFFADGYLKHPLPGTKRRG